MNQPHLQGLVLRGWVGMTSGGHDSIPQRPGSGVRVPGAGLRAPGPLAPGPLLSGLSRLPRADVRSDRTQRFPVMTLLGRRRPPRLPETRGLRR